ncbi:hypothetical protein [uncultured Tessaracoccus sp.]|uniref:hypothetical protein n=1 Tax=uncultured Tessaracoccus sp. TaxID=905023 RepID=UPI002636FF08|nr:hypothetical protein [uncultured Tessaracoccus sp.]
MSVSASARLWRWPAFAFVLVVAIVCVFALGDEAMDLPGADGHRYVRQFVISFMPVLGAVLLVDPTPELSATLPRTCYVYLTLRATTLMGILVPHSLAWSIADQPAAKSLYEAAIACVLISCSILAVSVWQASGVLLASLLAVAWLLAGDTLAMLLGFADITGRALPVSWWHWALALSSLGLVAVATLRGAGPTRWRCSSNR